MLEGGEDGDGRGILGLDDRGGDGGEPVGTAVDMGSIVVLDGASDVNDRTALSATGR